MNLAWTFEDFVSPKQHRPDLAGYPIIGRWVRLRMGLAARQARPHPLQPHLTAAAPRQRDVIAHVGGVAVEEPLLPLVSGLPAGRRTRAEWYRMTTIWV
jgi:hypothetical protein